MEISVPYNEDDQFLYDAKFYSKVSPIRLNKNIFWHLYITSRSIPIECLQGRMQGAATAANAAPRNG